jgi:hypothetical protein
MRKQCFRSIVVFILFFIVPFFIKTSVRAAVVINELLPKTEPATQEWVELYNTGSESVSLDRWRLQTATGVEQTFILNASAIIAPHGFLTFTGSQTGISFAIAGDTVRLFDEKNTEMDSQSYPGILGYNTSMGRSTDGDGTWVQCTKATFNTNNDCPVPSPTPEAPPTYTPTPTSPPQPTPTTQLKINQTPTDTPTPAQQTFGSFLPSPANSQVLGGTAATTPTPTPDQTKLTLNIDKILAYQILAVAIAWGSIIVVAFARRKRGIR